MAIEKIAKGINKYKSSNIAKKSKHFIKEIADFGGKVSPESDLRRWLKGMKYSKAEINNYIKNPKMQKLLEAISDDWDEGFRNGGMPEYSSRKWTT